MHLIIFVTNVKNMTTTSKILVFSLLLILFTGVNSCDDSSNPFPYVHVNETIYISTDLKNMLPGEIVFFGTPGNEGYGGFIIYRESETSFKVYDRACTYDYADGCILEEDLDWGTSIPTCPCCGSKFFITNNASVYNGPANVPLRRYNAYANGDVLKVTN